jgi:hypothetical protein
VGVALTRGRSGQVTRGKTARNRLRRTDTWVARDGVLRNVKAPLYVDVGYGAEPSTTIETLHRLQGLTTDLRVIGVEIARERVETAAVDSIPGSLEFRLGGFDLPLERDEQAHVIRAMNVLRQYDEHEHAPAIARMARCLADGGMLLEGTSTPTGRLLTANVYRRRGAEVVYEGLMLAPNLAREWRPLELRSVLPKNLIHHCESGSPLEAFFERWHDAYAEACRSGLAPRTAFVRAGRALGSAVDRSPSTLRRGFLFLHLPV